MRNGGVRNVVKQEEVEVFLEVNIMKGFGKRNEIGGLFGDQVDKGIMWIREQ